jgi:hypothetical protein
MGGKDDQLAIDSGPGGCKGYKPAAANYLKEKFINVRICSCSCDEEKEKAGARKQRRIDQKDLNIRALLGAEPAKQCQRFIKGICLLNKKGKKCSSSHDIQGLWDLSLNGKLVCVVKCELKPHVTIKGACINGKDCLYMHADTTANQNKCAQHFPPLAIKIGKSAKAIAYSPIFDATLGFPGEGPITVAVAMYIINGSRVSLAAIFAQAKISRIDILFLQELHFCEDGEHLHVGKLADRSGWAMVHSPATRLNP